MDVIKMETGSDPMGIQTSGIADIEEKKPLSEEENLLDLDLTEIKTECIDHRYDVKSHIEFENTLASTVLPIVKTEAEEEFCELDQVKEEVKLEVTTEENEALTESVAVSHNSGVATLCENFPQQEEVHTDGKKYDCDIRGKCFPDSARLKSHGLLNTGEKRFSCDVCGKRFSTSACLKNHSRVHKGEKSRCDACGKTFPFLARLKTHLRVHTGEKPFSCDECGRRFSVMECLKRHSQLHTGEKPLNCKVCGKRFSYEGSLKSHVRDVCRKTYAEASGLKTEES